MAKNDDIPGCYYSHSEGMWRLIYQGLPLNADTPDFERCRKVAVQFKVRPADVFWNGDKGEWQSLVGVNPTPRIPRGKAASKPSQLTGDAPSERLVKRRKKTAAQPIPGIWANPLTRVKVNDPPSRGGFEMDDRLAARRKLTNKKSTPKGFYANPSDRTLAERRALACEAMHYIVAGNDMFLAMFPHRQVAEEYLALLKKAHPSRDFFIMPL